MSDFIPPYPKRPAGKLGPLELLKSARCDLLSIWPESVFDRQFIVFKVLNRSLIIANHPEIVRHVLSTHHANYQKKSALMRKALSPLLGDSLLISDGAVWQKHRTWLEPMFANERLADYRKAMVIGIEDRMRSWSLKAGSTLPVLSEMKHLMAVILDRILFGKQRTEGQAVPMADYLSEYLAAAGQLDINALFSLPSWIPGKTTGKAGKIAKALHTMTDKLVAGYSTDSGDDSLLAQFLALRESEAGDLTHEQIRNELLTLFLAGHEPLANTLTWAWYLISQCPDVERRLHDEVDHVLAGGSAVLVDADKLAYTRAIIEETLRLYPPLPILIREAATADTIRNRPIPAGSMVLVAPWLLHRHKQYWDKPDHFIPERFLDEAPKPAPFAYIPFSAGPGTCLGKDFSVMALTLCLAVLSRNFRLQASQGYRLYPVGRLQLQPKENLVMNVTIRSGAVDA